ncbi:MAG: pentapeptide repeat-containing protein [Planctomycetota bacterium]|nr:pentapeptide repeat-containing protein [Planctomycetota bacterium]
MSKAEDWMFPFKPGDRCNIEQYKMLQRCSKNKDITEWNEWHDANLKEAIWLAGARLQRFNLQGADLWKANLQDAELQEANLQDAKLIGANLQGADLQEANLQGAKLSNANLQGAKLYRANLRDANLPRANLQGTDLYEANLRDAKLQDANLQGTDLYEANLRDAKLRRANLQGAKLSYAELQGTDFGKAILGGETLISDCLVDKETDFTSVGLDIARVEPGLKQLLKYNIRRRRWRKWYRDGAWWKQILKRVFIQPFWEMSDYGLRTGRILLCFWDLAALFAVVYCCWPGCLMVKDKVGDIQSPLHAFYFSFVTMTTLGFGDIHANPASWQGQVLLMVQVLLGYVLLAALVTRFAVLFTAGGPAGKFADEKGQAAGDIAIAMRAV